MRPTWLVTQWRKTLLAVGIVIAVAIVFIPSNGWSACTPTSARICANADDLISIWINGNSAGTFAYVHSYDGTPVSCNNISTAYLNATGTNTLAVRATSNQPQQVLGTWFLDVTCSGGNHAYATNADSGITAYSAQNTCTGLPTGSGGNWYDGAFVPDAAWVTAQAVSGTIWPKQLLHPQTGALMTPISYNSSA